MGMIADELDRNLITLSSLTSAKVPIIVNGHSFISLPMGGPVQGVAQVDTALLYAQIEALSKALLTVAKALRKLEDKK